MAEALELAPARAHVGYLRSLASLYAATIRTGIQGGLQYRVTVLVEALLMLVEPTIYLLVWQAVVRAEGGSVEGFDAGRVAAYYVAYAFLRPFLQTGSPHNWQGAIERGRMNAMLLRPLHPVHQDNAFWLGWAMIRVVQSLPAAIVLAIAFQPRFDTGPAALVVLPLAMILANQLRNLVSVCVGLTSFWLTRITAVAALNQAIEGMLSGRLVPIEMLPDWAQTLSWWLPFRWAFGFPIDVLTGGLGVGELLFGVAMQLLWLVIVVGLMNVEWRRGVAHYGAVGG